MRRRPRDPRHHNCLDRQAYHATGMWALGFIVCGLVVALGTPGWLVLVVGVVGLLSIPALHLYADGEERRRAALTAEDRAAGRW